MYFKQNKIIIFISCLLFTLCTYGQNNEYKNNIDSRLFPTYNGDFNFIFLRKNLRVNEFLFGGQYESYEDGTFQFRNKGYIPFIDKKKVSLTFPLHFDRYDFVSKDNNNRMPVYSLRIGSILSYTPQKEITLAWIIDHRNMGQSRFLTNKVGNISSHTLLFRYNLKEKLFFHFGAQVSSNWKYESSAMTTVEPYVLLKWIASPNLKIMVGNPGGGLEWSAPLGFDLTAHVVKDRLKVNIVGSLRKRIGKYFDVTTRYIKEGYSDLNIQYQRFFTESSSPLYSPPGASSLTNHYEKIQFEIGFRPQASTVIQLYGGMKLNNELELHEYGGNLQGIKATYFGVNISTSFGLKKADT